MRLFSVYPPHDMYIVRRKTEFICLGKISRCECEAAREQDA